MSRRDRNRTGTHVAAQIVAQWAALDAAERSDSLAAALAGQDRAFRDALSELRVVKDLVGSPEHILGNANTKHGEIAEQVHVAIRRALDRLHQQTPTATFEGVDRLGAVDYRDGVDIQSKFYNGLRNTLDGITSHAERYEEFASGEGRYHIPKDQFEQYRQLKETGTLDGLSARSIERLQQQAETLQQKTGRSLDELIRPGEARYDEVQQGRVHDTIRDRKNRLAEKNEELKEQIPGQHGPSLAGLANAAAAGAAAGGGVRFAQAVWTKYQDGRNPFRGDFSVEDWKDVGLETFTGAGSGAVAGGAVYLLTNATSLAAPFAGVLVSGLMGIGDLLGRHHAGEIDDAQFVDLSLMVAADAAIVGVCVATGQTLIPIPMLGAFVGSVAGKFVASAIRDGLGDTESALIERLKAYETEALGKLDDTLRNAMHELNAYFGRLDALARVAFDETVNVKLRLEASVRIAEALNVPDEQILRSTADLDTLMQE